MSLQKKNDKVDQHQKSLKKIKKINQMFSDRKAQRSGLVGPLYIYHLFPQMTGPRKYTSL